MEGYDVKFDPPLDKRLECPICLLAQRDPMQTPCGHRFCSPCILRALRETGPRCPVDNTRISHHQLFKDNFARREVLSLNVRCSADVCGCVWHGELRDLEFHSKNCELVTIDCPHTCGFNCQRKELSSHLLTCANKPQRCPTCSIFLPKNKRSDHSPYCSKIVLPESMQGNLFEANEVIKWCGHLKLKINSQQVQVVGYLSVKAESEESFTFTGDWLPTLNLITLNSPEARIFWRMLQSPEVQPQLFNFTVQSNDPKSVMFLKLLRKKAEVNAVVCLRLKPLQTRYSFTIIYFHWSDQRKRPMAYVAELKSHLVKQLQGRLQVLRSSRTRRNPVIQAGVRMPRTGRVHSTHPNPHHQHYPTPPHPPHPHPHPHPHVRAPPAAPPPGHPHIHTHLHPHPHPHPHPPSITVVNAHNPQQVPLQATQVVTASGPRILPNLLSWQMSQSLNTFPWRVQAAGVPFFTFPSTPPQFLPSNSYPYTFAPVPAAPFSINPMQPVPGIAVPQVAGDLAAGAAGPSFAVAAAIPAPVGEGDQLPAVAVTIAGAIAAHPDAHVSGNPLSLNMNVIQQSTSGRMGPDSGIHGQFQGGHHHIPPALIQARIARRTHPNLAVAADQEENRYTGPVSRHTVPPPFTADTHTLLDHTRGAEVHIVPRSVPLLSTSSTDNSDNLPSSSRNPFSSSQRNEVSNVWDDSPGPSHPPNAAVFYHRTHSDSSSDSEEDSSPLQVQLGSFSPLSGLSPLTSDSDTPSTPLLDSPTLFQQNSNSSPESNSTLSSDQEGVSPSQSDNESVGNLALHTLANAAAILSDTHTPLDSNEAGPSTPYRPNRFPQSGPLRLPVLINISDSDGESQIATPPSVIDLTHSPHSTSPQSHNTSSTDTSLGQREATAHPVGSETTSNSVPVLVPVIHSRRVSNSGRTTETITHPGLGRHPNVPPYITEGGAVAVQHHVTNISPANLAGQPQSYPPDFANTTVPVLGWPYEQQPMNPRLMPNPQRFPSHPPLQGPRGGFWETVMPSLDISLQNSSEPRSS